MRNGRRWRLGSGEVVIDRPNSHVATTHQTVLSLLGEALSRIYSEGRQFIAEEVDLGRIVGETICVATSDTDEIVYAQRPNRFGLTKFVKNRRPEPCSCVMVCLKKAEENGYYILATAYVGHKAPAEPWDTRWADEKSFVFWNTHALVWGREEVITGTETVWCPW